MKILEMNKAYLLLSRLSVEHREVNQYVFEVSYWFLNSSVWFSCPLATPLIQLQDMNLVRKNLAKLSL